MVCLKQLVPIMCGALLLLSKHALANESNIRIALVDSTFAFKMDLRYPEEVSAANRKYMENYILSYAKRCSQLKEKNAKLLSFFNSRFHEFGIPKEFAALAIIESELEQYSVSKAGAVGPWQFIEAQAAAFGLQTSKQVDERTDFYKSTFAACKLLNELYAHFGDWLLVVAAYNCGPNRVEKSMIKAQSNSFWEIEKYLPKETQYHVKKFICVSYLLNNTEPNDWLRKRKFKAKESEVINQNYLSCTVSSGYSLAVIAKKIQVSYQELSFLNPDFEKLRSTKSACLLKIPTDKMADFNFYKEDILKESIEEMMNSNKN
ncbi:lytic transglycosylase domain-containing protein [Pedobacter sp. MW01-1-1]|uniref:lytic transglycosylase domain-containing protein n=1 Tax=Pedobacter sp. MW01-1-1 TaxID=3383027 RepID=UPI003FF0AA4C